MIGLAARSSARRTPPSLRWTGCRGPSRASPRGRGRLRPIPAPAWRRGGQGNRCREPRSGRPAATPRFAARSLAKNPSRRSRLGAGTARRAAGRRVPRRGAAQSRGCEGPARGFSVDRPLRLLFPGTNKGDQLRSSNAGHHREGSEAFRVVIERTYFGGAKEGLQPVNVGSRFD